MSDLLSENVENIDIQAPQKMKKNKGGRRTLTELKANTIRQHTQGHLRAGKDFVVYEDSSAPSNKSVTSSSHKKDLKDQKVQCEPIEMKNSEAQTTLSGKSMDNAEAVALMYQEESGDENYWKDLAEKRLEALNESLHENEGLHIENADLHYQVSTLQENLKAAEEIVKEVKALCMSSTELIQAENEDGED